MVGNVQNRTEQRKKRRRQFHYSAMAITDKKGTMLPCSISDISDNGARIVLESDCALPNRFMLLLTPAGETRRRCRVVWRKGTTVGVAFRFANR